MCARKLQSLIREREKRKKLERQLRTFHAKLSSTEDFVYLLNLKGEFTYANQALLNLWNLKSAEALGKDFKALGYPPELVELHKRQLEEVISTCLPVRGENPYTDSSGETRFYEYIFTPVLDDQGQVEAIAGITRDITSRKHMESALQEALARETARASEFQALMDSVPAVVLLAHDPECRRITGSRKAHELLRVPLGGNLSKAPEAKDPARTFRVFQKGVELPVEQLPAQRAARGEQICGEEWEVRFDDGHKLYMFGDAVPLRDPDGRICGSLAAMMDITERKKMEEELRRSKEQRSVALEAAKMGTWVFDIATDTSHHDKRTSELLGIPGRMNVQTPELLDRIHKDDLERVVADLKRAFSPDSDGSFDSEYRIRSVGGGYRWVRSVGCVRNSDDQQGSGQFVGVTFDTTSSKLAERKLQNLNETLEQRVANRTAEAQERADQLQRLAGELTEVEQRERRRLAQLLQDDLQQLLVAAKVRLGAAGSGVAEAQKLLEQAIDTSRSLTTELAPPVLYDLGLNAGLEWLARWAQQNYRLNVAFESDDSEPVETEQTAVVLFNAVRELLLNVVKHAKSPQARLTLQRREGNVCVTVHDDGVGFNGAKPNGATGRADPRHSGYGLFSMQERFELLGGAVRIKSAPGVGTRVQITLPLPADRDRRLPETPVSAVHETKKTKVSTASTPPENEITRVLLVDDHDVVRQGIANLIEKEADIQIVGEAASGETAVDLAHQYQPDVVVMDISLPGISGIEATLRIMTDSPSISVIGLSMHEESDVAEALRAAGAKTYLNKSLAPEELLNAIRQFTPRGKKRRIAEEPKKMMS